MYLRDERSLKLFSLFHFFVIQCKLGAYKMLSVVVERRKINHLNLITQNQNFEIVFLFAEYVQ